ncbi:MAG: putative nucleotidyltransferase [Candidatus Nanohaloarchaea archaeon]|jgi:predicted nucleotidyltransferase
MDFTETVFEAVEEAGLDTDSVNFIYVFGSYLDDPESANDIDICVSLEVEEPEKAEYRLKGRVPEKVDISVFEALPLQVRKEVLSGKLIHKKGDKVYDKAYETIREFESYERLYKTAIGA